MTRYLPTTLDNVSLIMSTAFGGAPTRMTFQQQLEQLKREEAAALALLKQGLERLNQLWVKEGTEEETRRFAELRKTIGETVAKVQKAQATVAAKISTSATLELDPESITRLLEQNVKETTTKVRVIRELGKELAQIVREQEDKRAVAAAAAAAAEKAAARARKKYGNKRLQKAAALMATAEAEEAFDRLSLQPTESGGKIGGNPFLLPPSKPSVPTAVPVPAPAPAPVAPTAARSGAVGAAAAKGRVSEVAPPATSSGTGSIALGRPFRNPFLPYSNAAVSGGSAVFGIGAAGAVGGAGASSSAASVSSGLYLILGAGAESASHSAATSARAEGGDHGFLVDEEEDNSDPFCGGNWPAGSGLPLFAGLSEDSSSSLPSIAALQERYEAYQQQLYQQQQGSFGSEEAGHDAFGRPLAVTSGTKTKATASGKKGGAAAAPVVFTETRMTAFEEAMQRYCWQELAALRERLSADDQNDEEDEDESQSPTPAAVATMAMTVESGDDEPAEEAEGDEADDEEDEEGFLAVLEQEHASKARAAFPFAPGHFSGLLERLLGWRLRAVVLPPFNPPKHRAAAAAAALLPSYASASATAAADSSSTTMTAEEEEEEEAGEGGDNAHKGRHKGSKSSSNNKKKKSGGSSNYKPRDTAFTANLAKAALLAVASGSAASSLIRAAATAAATAAAAGSAASYASSSSTSSSEWRHLKGGGGAGSMPMPMPMPRPPVGPPLAPGARNGNSHSGGGGGGGGVGVGSSDGSHPLSVWNTAAAGSPPSAMSISAPAPLPPSSSSSSSSTGYYGMRQRTSSSSSSSSAHHHHHHHHHLSMGSFSSSSPLFPYQPPPMPGAAGGGVGEGSSLSSSSSDGTGTGTGTGMGTKRRENLTREQKQLFITWFCSHLSNPYPTDVEKRALAEAAGTTVERCANWFINARSRDLKHLMERRPDPTQPSQPGGQQ